MTRKMPAYVAYNALSKRNFLSKMWSWLLARVPTILAL